MTIKELKEHIRDIIDDQKDCPLPIEVALEKYAQALLKLPPK